MKTKSVTEKIHKALTASSDDDSDDSNYENSAKIVDFDQGEYEQRVPSKSTDFRKKNVKLLSEQSNKYKGKIVSRKDLQVNDDDNEKYEISESDEADNDNNPIEESSEDEESGMEGEDSDEDKSEISSDSGDDTIPEAAVSESKKQEEIRKGASVQNQLRLWERLLEVRIRTQKLLNKSNELPPPDESNDYSSDVAKETVESVCFLLKNLLELKSSLTDQFSELRMRMKRASQETSAFDNYKNGEPPLKRIASQLEDQHNRMRSYRNEVLLKWDDRTKLLTPGAGSKKRINEEIDVVRKIENTLLNREVLIANSRSIRNPENYTAGDATDETTENNSNVYDDTDFYHQQLRELIEYKTNSSSTGSEVAKKIVELQKIRQKMKRSVDQRASKGRKIRYMVHNKLVNFMAPDSTADSWTDASKDELYKSLFGT